MLAFPHIDPVLVSLGPLQVRWYGLMYVLGFTASYFLVRSQIRRFGFRELEERFENVNLLLILLVILGGRLGYVLFYNPAYYLRHPLEIFATWQGGMSFHGACLAVLLGGYLHCRRAGLDFWRAGDLYVVTVPIGLGLGRLGNFINAELPGRVTALPWGMVFPGAGPAPRHPSQLYEALLEGILLFSLLWALKERPWQKPSLRGWPHGSMMGLFLLAYGVLRILVENLREPDAHIGLLALGLTMGQVLSGLMVLAGILLWRWRVIDSSLRTNNGGL